MYPLGPVIIIFSDTRDQLHHTVEFVVENTKTSVLHNGTEIKEEASGLKYNAINSLEISFSETQIIFDKNIQVLNDFYALRFISFKSDNVASWVVQQSK